MQNQLPDVATAAEAAEYLRISESQLIALAREKRIGVMRIGRRTLFPRAVIEAFIHDHTEPPAPNSWGLTGAQIDRILTGRAERTTRGKGKSHHGDIHT
ncbi:MAG: DNA-binding protein [Herbiconiux sp.]|uniref:helix-turn-helix domain-containing protein n=1 Tax=Herbiconiux sp. TaxID=1871186 RepID=UPI001214D4DA|nr:helix-turn-helix domain-containing protein [Herbiconiux sp.]TAJ48868.1 MAG: DNA-binding protein [Herbiconiux sp.]